MAAIKNYPEFCDEGKEAIELINRLASYALGQGDREGYNALPKVKDNLKTAGSKVNANRTKDVELPL